MSTGEFELVSPPEDGISALQFSPGPANVLMASSWDQTIRLYDIASNVLRSQMHAGAPALDCCFSNPIQGFSGQLDGSIKSYDFNMNAAKDLGKHDDGVKAVEYSSTTGMLISGSWDKTIKVWDPRTKDCNGTYSLPDKVYTMSTGGDKLIVGTAGRHVWVYDLRKMGDPEQRRESSLKYQTRCIKMATTGDRYVLSSIDGRISVEWIDPSPEVQKKKYAFKCHRVKADGQDTIYPVNCISFHPGYGTFASGGCDGIVNIWDGANKKRLSQFHRYPTSISALAFNHDGKYLAIASSYTYEEGEKDHPADAIYIHETTDAETKPK
eukprot:m.51271 g.51271  ORF g.51271 m.51271 type:complete len:324 (-) comp10723_c0_seq1:1255-2226(-)